MTDEAVTIEGLSCPIPLSHGEQIVMGHGSGGKMTHDLIRKAFLPCFDNPSLRAGDDAGTVHIDEKTRLAVSTDMHTVQPLFFPGGDIGRLAVCGTVNDVAMVGARPLFLSAGFILEEGLEMDVLSRVITSMQTAATEAGVQIVAGDTKVVQRGKADGLYINTTGIGILPAGMNISGANARPGDAVIVSGTLGDHGMAVVAARGQLGLETELQSDVAALNHIIAAILEQCPHVHVLRDPTRGGLGTTLNEIAQQSRVSILLQEGTLPVRAEVEAACAILGFDPLYIANEGKFIAIVAPNDAESVLEILHKHPLGRQAAVIGEVQSAPAGRVLMKTSYGSTRIVDMLAGEILPRIC
jgi:hydrogenase expression/formation protein HypE